MKSHYTELKYALSAKLGFEVTNEYVHQKTGVKVPTLKRLASNPPKNVTIENIAPLCPFFGVGMGDIVEYIPDPATAPEKEQEQ